MPRILNIGSINLDEVFSVPHFIRPGETMSCRTYERFVGGKGNNQSTALGRAGADVHHAGKIGQDGHFAAELLADSGVDISRVRSAEVPTGRALIQVDETGQNCIILFGGANRAITRDDIDSFLEGWSKGDSVLFQNEISSLAYAMDEARKKGLRIYFNPSPADELLAGLPLDAVDCFILNEVEGAMLAGAEASMGASQVAWPDAAPEARPDASLSTDPDAMLAALRRRFPRAELLLTLGASGARFEGPDGIKVAVQARRVKAVDTTAAGDTFTGYFIAARLREESPQKAMEEATAAAAICVQKPGAAASIPYRAELEG
ncbi:MAG: ribokinase [Spirochaetia bacterium]|jgi:ribokinase|nr:ribokinase [Spirochaetia bacterium]